MKTFLEFVPGEARQLAPGQDVAPVGQSPEVQNLFLEFAESRRRLEAFMLSPVSKGVSPGADTSLPRVERFRPRLIHPRVVINRRRIEFRRNRILNPTHDRYDPVLHRHCVADLRGAH